MSTTTIDIERDLAAIAPPISAEQFTLRASEQLQELHYDEISADYNAHYNDEYSVQYRTRFIYEPLFNGLSLSGADVLDAMCGSGVTTEHLLARGARVTGLDISNEIMDSFSDRWPQCTAVRRSIFASGLPNESFDYVVIVGGLHHIQPNVSRALEEIHRVLRKGGHLCFMEPHARSLPDLIRRWWYRHDHFFSDNEESIDVEQIEGEFRSRFKFKTKKHLGNLAFLLVFNSLIFRIPLRLKFLYSPLLLKLEPLLNRIQGRLNSCFVIAQWQKI